MNIVDKYNVTYKSYDELYREEQYDKYNYIFNKAGIFPKGRIIDVGCGTGLLIEYLKSIGYDQYNQYICLEPSINMLKTAMNKSFKDPRIIYVNSFCEDIIFPKNTIDQAYLFTVWDNLEDPVKCLNNILYSLKLEGFIIVSIIAKSIEYDKRYEVLSIFNPEYIGEKRDKFYIIWRKHVNL